jgi:hypothetical protein
MRVIGQASEAARTDAVRAAAERRAFGSCEPLAAGVLHDIGWALVVAFGTALAVQLVAEVLGVA